MAKFLKQHGKILIALSFVLILAVVMVLAIHFTSQAQTTDPAPDPAGPPPTAQQPDNQQNTPAVIIAELANSAQGVDVNGVLDMLSYDETQAPQIAQSLYDTANALWEKQRYGDCQDIYRYISQEMSRNDHTDIAALWDIGADIHKGNTLIANQRIADYIANHAEDPALQDNLLKLANAMWIKGDSTEAAKLYDDIAEWYPDSDLLMVQRRIAEAAVYHGNLTLINNIVGSLRVDYADDPRLPQNLWELAKVMCRERYFADAENIFDQIVQGQGENLMGFRACAQSYVCQIKQKRPLNASEILTALQSQYPMTMESEDLFDIAGAFWWKKRYEDARQVYQAIVDWLPQSDHARWSQIWVMGADVKLGRSVSPSTVITVMESVFMDLGEMTKAAYSFAEQYEQTEQYDNAIALYNYLLENWSDNYHNLFTDMRLFRDLIRQGQTFNPQDLISYYELKYDGHSEHIVVINDLARAEYDIKHQDQAYRLWSYLIDTWGETLDLRTQQICAKAALYLGNEEALATSIDILLTDIHAQTDVLPAIHDIMETAMSLGRYEDILTLGQRVIAEHPGHFKEPEMQYLMALCSKEVEDYSAAAEYFTSFYENSQCRYKSRVPVKMGMICRRIGDSERAISWLREQQFYPDETQLQKAMLLECTILMDDQRNFSAALTTLDEYALLFPGSPKWPLAMRRLAECYRQAGDMEQTRLILKATASANK